MLFYFIQSVSIQSVPGRICLTLENVAYIRVRISYFQRLQR
jgi:hypothetical protein